MSALSLSGLLSEVWRRGYLVMAVMVLSAALAILVILFATPIYTARMLVAPKPSTMIPDNGVGDLKALALGRSSGNFSPLEAYTSLVTSRVVADELAKDPALMKRLFASSWDEKTQSWRRPPGKIEEYKDWLRPYLGRPSWSPPNGATVALYLRGNLDIGPASSTLLGSSSIQVLSTSSPDPPLAVEMLERVNRAADGSIRDRMLTQLTSEIAFLRGELAQPQSTDGREALIRVLANLQQQRILLNGSGGYAVMIVDPPSATPFPVFPNPTMIMGTFLVFGILLSGILVLSLRSRPALALHPSAIWRRRRRLISREPAREWNEPASGGRERLT